MDIFVDALLDALKDTAIVIPLLYLSYLLVGYFSHNNSGKYSKILHRTKKAGPLLGAFLGCLPQCGFSSVMSNLYSHKIVTIGTLFAVFIATSDEAIPIMIANPKFIPSLLIMLALKLGFAIIIGYGLDLSVKLFDTIGKKRQKKLAHLADNLSENATESAKNIEVFEHDQHENNTHDHEHDEHNEHECIECAHHHHVLTHEHDCTCQHNEDEEFLSSGCTHEHTHSDCCAKNIFLHALKHTAIITAYVFVATLAINLLVGYCKLETIQAFFPQSVYLQLLIACAIGLIPNCAASIFLVEMYMAGIITFAPLVAGLCAGAGVGLIVLFTSNKKQILKNLLIVVGLYALAFLCGLVTNFIPFN